jgi:hypothetical protein
MGPRWVQAQSKGPKTDPETGKMQKSLFYFNFQFYFQFYITNVFILTPGGGICTILHYTIDKVHKGGTKSERDTAAM